MIDFNNASFLKLRPVPGDAYAPMLAPMLIDGEQIISSYQSIRDGVVFTNKRIFAVNVQGLTGKKKDFTSLPYSRIQTFSVESAGVIESYWGNENAGARRRYYHLTDAGRQLYEENRADWKKYRAVISQLIGLEDA